MCGIAGLVTNKIGSKKEVIERIIISQESRGPDNSMVEEIMGANLYAVFGHNRLSINDLSKESNQPYWDRSKRYSIVFNGEIYNYVEIKLELEANGYQFSTTGDTEVLLAALIVWGYDAIKKLNGMFAFAFMDTLTGDLIVARDRFSKKPLYYWYDSNSFYFASTTTRIAKELGLRPNLEYLDRGLKYWSYENHSSETQYDGLHSLMGGYFIRVNYNKNILSLNFFQYYNLEEGVLKCQEMIRSMDEFEIKEYLMTLYHDSIKIRLRSDVPIAISLSGGLDSSTIAAITKGYIGNLDGITFGKENEKLSEGPVVKKLSDYLGIKVNYVWPDSNNIIEAFENSFKAQDSPIINTSYIAEYLIYEKANNLGFKVMLGGQGGDEVFMGYRKYQFYKILDEFKSKKYFSTILQASYVTSILKNEYFQIDNYLKSMNRYSRAKGLNSIINFGLDDRNYNVISLKNKEPWRRQIVDLLSLSVPVQVKSEDRNSMANSVETRAPLLDYRLAEFGIALPVNYKVNKGYGKWIIREIMEDMIPDEIRLAKFKRGYDVTQDWIGMGLGKHLRERLLDNKKFITPFLNKGVDLDFFTEDYMRNNKSSLQEITTLLWLAEKN